MTEIALRGADVEQHRPSTGLALSGDQIEWTPVQRAALDHIGIADAPAADQQVFMHVCQRTGLDPFARQIYMIPRKEGQGQNAKVKWTIQTGIDGFRAKAAERPEYRGQIGPQWCGDDGVWRDVWVSPKPPTAARVGILRDDMSEPLWGVAMYREYVQNTTWDGRTKPTKMWEQKPAHMTAKCAEALGLRRAFPDQLSGLYTDDEMGHLDNPAGRRVRTVIEHDTPRVTAAELTGATPPPSQTQPAEIEPAEQPAGPVASSPPADPSADVPPDGRMGQGKQVALLAAMRKSDVDDRWGWASGVLGRDVTSYGQLGDLDADRLIADLAQSGGEA